MSKRQPNKPIERTQREIDEANKLRQDIAFLKTIPQNFRDIPFGSTDWNRLMIVMPDLRSQMETWAAGDMIFFRAPSDKERRFLEHSKGQHEVFDIDTTSFYDVYTALDKANELGVSWAFGLPNNICRNFNGLLSFFNWNIRFRIIPQDLLE